MYLFIINPIAGNGRAKRIFLRIQKNESYKKLQTDHVYTKYKGHAEIIAKNLKVTTVKLIIVIGGDGTIHEVLNGLQEKQIPISFIPGGSGNDFARGALIPTDPNEVINNIFMEKENASYWLGMYQDKGKEDRLFANCIGFGFDAVVANRANQSTFKKWFNYFRLGKLIYLFALIWSLFTYRPSKVTIKIDDITKTFEKCFLLTINNHAYFGGGMKINPNAHNNENNLSILVVDSISKWKVITLFATVFTGKHLHFKEVKTFQGKNMQVCTERLIPYQVDGETGTTRECIITKKPFPVQVKGSNLIN